MKKVLTVTLNPSLDKTFNLEEFTPGRVNRCSELRIDAGGKGINVSRALANFRTPTLALGISGGENGKILKELLLSEGVESDFLETDGNTRMNYKIFDKKTKDTTDINEAGIPMTPEILTLFMEKYKTHLKSADYVVLAGSLPPKTDERIYRILGEEASKQNVRVILDTEGQKLREGIKALPFAIKPNIHEFEDLCGKTMKNRADILNSIREVHESGVELVVVTLGGDGAIFMQGNTAYKTLPLSTDRKSTVGCGDSVVAGMCYSLINGFDLKKTAMICAAAGSLTASKDGTNMCTKEEVICNYSKVITDRIEFL